MKTRKQKAAFAHAFTHDGYYNADVPEMSFEPDLAEPDLEPTREDTREQYIQFVHEHLVAAIAERDEWKRRALACEGSTE